MTNKVFFTFEGDKLVKTTPCPQCGEDCYKSETVIDKGTFLECMKRWMTDTEELLKVADNKGAFSSKACESCSNNPKNGGSGICYCIIGTNGLMV